MPNMRQFGTKCPLEFVWNEEDECWCVKTGDITVAFLEPGELIVSGHDVTAQVSYDQITEERGLLFQDHAVRRKNDASYLGAGEVFNPVPHIVNPKEDK